MSFIKRIEGAYYDPNTDTIFGCEEGSFVWHHENRHRYQHQKWDLLHYMTLALDFSILLTVMTQNWKFSLIGVIARIIPEIDAWAYSIYLLLIGKIAKSPKIGHYCQECKFFEPREDSETP